MTLKKNSWLIPYSSANRRMRGPLSKFTINMVALASQVWLKCLNRTKIYNRDTFLDIVEHRDKHRGLLTVCNHYSCIDDPLVWGILKWKFIFRPFTLRWTPAAEDIVFTRRIFSYFFTLGRVIPLSRGAGVFQKTMDFCVDQLNNGGWVHMFPEGKVNLQKEQMRLKWGIGRLIADAKVTPIVLPIFHIGFDKILPNKSPYIPRIFKQVTIVVGTPLEFGEDIKMLHKQNKTHREIRKYITDRVQEEMLLLRQRAERIHFRHLNR